ncbi:MAG: hypothetical protein D6689_13510 [Deltaproteobacteria bacterium]|nr:MAG: hypothetical protein D6689_13510 [Deltaproteobacteria bacterium]
MTAGRTCVLAVAAVVATSVSGVARAGGDDRSASVGLAYGRLSLSDRDAAAHGAVLAVDYERGLSDALSLRASAGGGAHYDGGAAYSAYATLSIVYLFDVLKYVPYASVGAGAVFTAGGDLDADLAPAIELGAGLEVLRGRDASWGMYARAATWADGATLVTAGARLTWRWGYF